MALSRESSIQSIKLIIYGYLYHWKFHATKLNFFWNSTFLLCLKANCRDLLTCMCFNPLCKTELWCEPFVQDKLSKSAIVNWYGEMHSIKTNIERTKVSIAHMMIYDILVINCLESRMTTLRGSLSLCISCLRLAFTANAGRNSPLKACLLLFETVWVSHCFKIVTAFWIKPGSSAEIFKCILYFLTCAVTVQSLLDLRHSDKSLCCVQHGYHGGSTANFPCLICQPLEGMMLSSW